MTRLLLTFGLALSVAGPLSAQTVSVRAGDDIRLTSPAAAGRFTVEDASGEMLTLRDSAGQVTRVPLNSVTKLTVSRGQRSRGAGALRGAGIGLAIGTAAGITVGLASGDDPDGIVSFSAEEKAVMGAILLGGGMGLVGGAIGMSAPGQRWERIPVGHSARVGVARDGGVALRYAISF